MPDMLEKGLAWLADQQYAFMSRTVVYSRGADSVAWVATIGRTEFEQHDEYGIVHRTESRDFLGRASELILGGATALPEAGDQIRETAGDKTFVYEVMAPPPEPPFRYSDPFRRTLRIHTKFIGME
jgi:hypothetical protein